jgi:nucleoside triphosphate pyrophosphatase
MSTRPRLILASASPRRSQLLADAGFAFEVDPSTVEEWEPRPGMPPAEYVTQLAWLKASSVAARRGRGLILAADTVCAVHGQILGKPVDRADAERMLVLQEGRDSDVLTGLCLLRAELAEWVGTVETSVCRFRTLTAAERAAHLDSNRWVGKAGAYGIQDHDPFVQVVQGSRSNVVGLPLERLQALLQAYPGLARGPGG